jgi:hypothetical protein
MVLPTEHYSGTTSGSPTVSVIGGGFTKIIFTGDGSYTV